MVNNLLQTYILCHCTRILQLCMYILHAYVYKVHFNLYIINICKLLHTHIDKIIYYIYVYLLHTKN